MAERSTYPYMPGEYGIDLSPQIDGSRVKTESGRLLRIVHNPSMILLADYFNAPFFMAARINDRTDTLTLDLQTRDEDGRRHPDMFAAHFITFALRYFKEQGKIPQHLLSTWLAGSDNFLQFEALVEKGVCMEEAVRLTWTGIQARRHDFTDVGPIQDYRWHTDPKIKVLFSKPPEKE